MKASAGRLSSWPEWEMLCYIRTCGGLYRAAREAGLGDAAAHRYVSHRLAEEEIEGPGAFEVARFWFGSLMDRAYLGGHLTQHDCSGLRQL